jgi:hypothetical protein
VTGMDDQALGERLRERLHERDEPEVAPELWAAIERRRRWDPWRRAGRAGLALALLAAAVVLVPRVVDREPTVDRPPERVVPTEGWKSAGDWREGWQLRYPPGWTTVRSPTEPTPTIYLYPPGIRPGDTPFDADFYVEAQLGFQPRVDSANVSWTEHRRPHGVVVQRAEQAGRLGGRSVTYQIAWREGGRWLAGTVSAGDRALWARYGTLGEAILATLDRAGAAPKSTVTLPSVPACLQAFRFRLWVGGPPGPPKAWMEGQVELRAAGGCLHAAEATAILQDGQGRPLAVDGNPARATLKLDPAADPPILRPAGGWRWTNWCGGPGPFRFVVTVQSGGRTVGTKTVDLTGLPSGNGPPCLNRVAPSNLAALAGSELP